MVVAVSGGADSLALLHMLRSWQQKLKIQLHVATLNHQLRDDAHYDVQYVIGIAEQLNVPVISGTVDVPQIMDKEQLGVETAARQARYQFLRDVAYKIGAKRVVTAHHLNDQAETVLLNILRGTGTHGIGGMRLESPLPFAPDLTLVRPLLFTSRSELLDYCTAHNLQPRHDPTNDDITLIRNKVRHVLLPMLGEFNPQVEQALGRLAEISQVDDDYLILAYQREVQPYLLEQTGIWQFDRNRFRALHPAMQRRLIANLSGDETNYDHILAACELAVCGDVGAVWQFPGGVQLWIDYDMLLFGTQVRLHDWFRENEILLQTEAEIISYGEYPQLNWTLVCQVDPPGEDKPYIKLPLYPDLKLRGRLPGDWLILPGVGRQKLKDWLINHKVPRQIRDHVPCLAIHQQILALFWQKTWIVFVTPLDTNFHQAYFYVNYL